MQLLVLRKVLTALDPGGVTEPGSLLRCQRLPTD